jgi:hypothetical protein
MTKTCSKCKKEKELSEYPKDKSTKSGHTSSCKECRYSRTNEWARNNYQENKKEVLEKNSNWRRKNWDAVVKQRKDSGYNKRSQNKWYHNKAKYNIQHVLKERLRRRMRHALNGKNKSVPTLKLLGCDIDFFKQYLQDRFVEGMSWDNYGDWHIDHIIPCDSFDLTIMDEQFKCFHYTNLQPLWASENFKKSNSILKP